MEVVDTLKGSPSTAQHAFVAVRTFMNWVYAGTCRCCVSLQEHVSFTDTR